MAKMNNEDKILKILEQMQGDINGMKTDISDMKTDINGAKIDINSMKTDINSLKEDMGLVKTQLKEHGSMLSALKTASEVHKADIDNLTHQVANLSQEMKSGFKEVNQRIDNITKDLSVVEAVTGKNMTDIAHLKAAK